MTDPWNVLFGMHCSLFQPHKHLVHMLCSQLMITLVYYSTALCLSLSICRVTRWATCSSRRASPWRTWSRWGKGRPRSCFHSLEAWAPCRRAARGQPIASPMLLAHDRSWPSRPCTRSSVSLHPMEANQCAWQSHKQSAMCVVACAGHGHQEPALGQAARLQGGGGAVCGGVRSRGPLLLSCCSAFAHCGRQQAARLQGGGGAVCGGVSAHTCGTCLRSLIDSLRAPRAWSAALQH